MRRLIQAQIINQDHGKLTPSCWLGDSGAVSTWISVFIRTNHHYVTKCNPIVAGVRNKMPEVAKTSGIARQPPSNPAEQDLTAAHGAIYSKKGVSATDTSASAARVSPQELDPSGYLFPTKKPTYRRLPSDFVGFLVSASPVG